MSQSSSDTAFFGHPRGLATLFFTEMWERFSFYGLRAVVILFMTAAVTAGGLGWGVGKAGAIYGTYAALVAVPSILTPVSTFQVLQFLGLANSRWALVALYSGADIVSILIFIQFIRNISTEIDDSARIEGASYFQIFFRLILPMLAPAIATVVILRCVYIYNDFVLPFLYAARPSENTVSMMLFTFASINSTVSQAVIMAAVVLVIAPTLVAFFFLQRFIYAGITNGSVKG